MVNFCGPLLVTVVSLHLLSEHFENKNASKGNGPFELAAFKRPCLVADVVGLLVENIHLSEATHNVLLD